jgi:hypothetical protein
MNKQLDEFYGLIGDYENALLMASNGHGDIDHSRINDTFSQASNKLETFVKNLILNQKGTQ